MNMLPEISTPLTVKEQKVLDVILTYQEREGRTPSTREVAQCLGLKSQGSVMQYWRALERKGAIERLPGKARSVVVKQAARREDGRPLFIDVPIRGEINAGRPVDAPAQVGDVLPVHASSMGLTANSKPFALRVHGDSMIGACIQSGDYVVLDPERVARHGDVVAALLDGESTLKRLMVEDGQSFLKPENPLYPVLKPKRDLVIQGVMVGLVRGAGVESPND